MSSLFSPCSLGPFSLRNPVVFLPFYTAYADVDGMVTNQLLSHYKRIAATGVGLVVVEASAIRDKNLAPVTLRAFDKSHLHGLRSLADGIHAEGARAVLQICHPGRFSGRAGGLAPSPVPPFGQDALMPRQMSRDDIRSAAKAFAESAVIVRESGFDGVELHGGTGYLLASFTSPRTNRRTDAYGGDIENRIRFPLEVFQAVREAVDDYPVGYRFMAREYLSGGLDLEDGLVFAQALADKVSPAYLSVTAGTHECFAVLAKGKQKSPKGFMLQEAEAVKKAVPGTPVIAAGQLQDKEICEQALNGGMADAVGLGRVLFADYEWLRKLSGINPAPVRVCVQCGNCQKQISKGSPAFCSRWSREEAQEYLRHVPKARM